MKILATVLSEEKYDIAEIFELERSINTFVTTLANEILEIDEQNWLYKKLMKDKLEIEKRYRSWWERMSEKYDFDKKLIPKAYVNFSSNEVILNE